MNTLHLFAGAGGGLIADMMLGHTPVGAVEIVPYCQQVLLQRQKDGLLPAFPIFSDVREFKGDEIKERVDCVSGGFPCQDISAAGKRAGINGKESSLFFELIRICEYIRPTYIFLENSPLIVGNGLDTVLREVDRLGYNAEWACLAADQLGAWHQRKRWWCLCKKRGAADIPDTEDDRTGKRQWRDSETETIYGTGNLDTRGIEGNAEWWKAEPGVGRVADGVANRVDRLAAIGNGQVPACAVAAWSILKRRIEEEL